VIEYGTEINAADFCDDLGARELGNHRTSAAFQAPRGIVTVQTYHQGPAQRARGLQQTEMAEVEKIEHPICEHQTLSRSPKMCTPFRDGIEIGQHARPGSRLIKPSHCGPDTRLGHSWKAAKEASFHVAGDLAGALLHHKP
jgi:hypothetical protein